MKAGLLRHRINFLSPTRVQDSTTGVIVTTWSTTLSGIPAQVVPVSVKEFIAAAATQSQISARIVIRHRSGLKSDMRIEHDGKLYDPAGFLTDPETGRDYLTIPVIEVKP